MALPRRALLSRSLATAILVAAIGPWPVLADEPGAGAGPAVPEAGNPIWAPPAGGPDTAATAPPLSPAISSAVVTVNVNLYRPSAVVPQYTNYWCVPANAQSMLNIINGIRDRTYRNQARYAWHIHRLNRYTYPTRGNDVAGWAAFLDLWLPGDLHYRDRSFTSQAMAIAAIVESVDRTGHPVGIVVDRGSHAWTVLGYRATLSPRDPASRRIVGLYVSGSLYRIRGKTEPYPYRYFTLAQFKARFTRYHEASRSVVWEGQYVIVSE